MDNSPSGVIGRRRPKRLLREYFVQRTKTGLDLLRRIHKLAAVVHRSKAAGRSKFK
jgi:hypothetical protein